MTPKLLHLSIAYCILMFLIVIVRQSVSYGITHPAKSDDNWMVRDTRVKAKLCAILYGSLGPLVIILSATTMDGIYHSAFDTPLLVLLIISSILNVLMVILQWKHITSPCITYLNWISYGIPILTILAVIILCNAFHMDI